MATAFLDSLGMEKRGGIVKIVVIAWKNISPLQVKHLIVPLPLLYSS
jgi:hypothetical protein